MGDTRGDDGGWEGVLLKEDGRHCVFLLLEIGTVLYERRSEGRFFHPGGEV